jgi:MFS family permease
VLSNTTLGVTMATIDISIMLIALPDIFRGIHIDPLAPGNSFYLLWLILSFMVVTSVLVVSLGRLGDMYGRVRMYNLGFVVYTLFSLLLTVTWFSGTAAAIYLVVMRIFQGVGAALLLANSAAILTDAFPEDQRGMAIGINQVAAISGSFLGLVLGGVLAPIQWRLIFLVSVPIGLFGTVWAYRKLREVPRHGTAKVDWPGNITFALGLIGIMIGITYGIQPYGHSTMGWMSPFVIGCLAGGVALLTAFAIIETKVADPMFRLPLFKIRAFTAGSLSSLLASIGRGGLMFILIIWLQGIWLPRHGFSFSQTPLWAGIYMLPLTAGFLLAGPVSGFLSDRFGSRPFASGGMVVAAGSFLLLEMLPINFLLLGVRAHPAAERPGHGSVRRAEPGRRHEQPAAAAPRGRLGDELHVPEQRSGPVHRRLLHADDPGVVGHPAGHAVPRPRGARRPGPGRVGGGAPAAGVDAVRRVPRLQPGPAPGGPGRPGPAARASGRDAHRARLLSRADLRPVCQRTARGLRFRDRGVPGRGRDVLAARRQVPLPGASRRGRARRVGRAGTVGSFHADRAFQGPLHRCE